MPWKERTTMSLRWEFVQYALQEGVNLSALCRKFGISRKTAYKWLRRYREGGWEAVQDRSRRPHTSPNRTPSAVEAAVLAVRRDHPSWGGRKIHACLRAHLFPWMPLPSRLSVPRTTRSPLPLLRKRESLTSISVSSVSKPFASGNSDGFMASLIQLHCGRTGV